MARLCLAALSTVALLVLSASVALGAKPVEHISEQFDETFPGQTVCGIVVTVHERGHENVLVYADGTVKDTSRAKVTFSNADGDWVEYSTAGRRVINESLQGDILTVHELYSGLQSKFRTSTGQKIAGDRGRIAITAVIDLNGPGFVDDVLISREITVLGGPHPEAEGGFTLFCDVITYVLG